MKKAKTLGILILITCLFPLQVRAQSDGDPSISGGDRRAQTGMKFLTVTVSPRAAAMGDALTASRRGNALSMFQNPAAMSEVEGWGDVSLARTQWFADINHSSGALAIRAGNYGVFGVSVKAVNYGDMLGTIRSGKTKGYTDTGTISANALAIGLGYARTLTNRFSVGGDVRYVRQSLGESVVSASGGNMSTQDNSVGTAAFDLGVTYRTGYRSLIFASSVRNFSPEVSYEEESFELPLSFQIGVSLDVFDFTSLNSDTHSFMLAVEGRHPRDFAEQVRYGAEYTFMDILSLRVGYVSPSDERGINLGAGLNYSVSGVDFHVDYAYTNLGRLGDVNRFGINFGF